MLCWFLEILLEKLGSKRIEKIHEDAIKEALITFITLKNRRFTEEEIKKLLQ